MHGDQVLVEMGRLRHDGKAEGRIVRVMEREQETVVGIFHYGDGSNFVNAHRRKDCHGDHHPPGHGISQSGGRRGRTIGRRPRWTSARYQGFANTRLGPQADLRSEPVCARAVQPPSPARDKPLRPPTNTPHRVLGEEAQRKTWDDLEGVVVEVEIVQWPSATQSPRGRVTEILGYEDDFGVDVEMIIRKHHIPHVFPAEVLEEAQEFSPLVPEKEIAAAPRLPRSAHRNH